MNLSCFNHDLSSSGGIRLTGQILSTELDFNNHKRNKKMSATFNTYVFIVKHELSKNEPENGEKSSFTPQSLTFGRLLTCRVINEFLSLHQTDMTVHKVTLSASAFIET